MLLRDDRRSLRGGKERSDRDRDRGNRRNGGRVEAREFREGVGKGTREWVRALVGDMRGTELGLEGQC